MPARCRRFVWAESFGSRKPPSKGLSCALHNPKRPLTDIKKSFATACRRAGLSDVTPHTLRHTCASWLVQAGIPLYEVARLLGHSAITTTQRYAHLAPDHLRAAIDALSTPATLCRTPTQQNPLEVRR